MEASSGNQKFFSYVILLASLFILIFITRGLFYTLQENLDDRSEYMSDLDQAQKELSELNQLHKNFNSNQDELLQDVSKYTIDFTSENMFNYMYSYVESINAGGKDAIVIRSLSFSEGSVGDLGFTEGSVTISAGFSSQRSLLNFINYLTSKDSQYTFFIETFTYPNFGKDGTFQATIPLKMFYKK